jgi:hypothetical protein|tara:strand:+ start:318 stop:482 length:165 start_codon:yes stop_codon:yes gene_type:complete
MNNELKDTVGVLGANAGALGLTLTECNEILQFVSLSLAIIYTVYKFYKFYNKVK